ncbi:MAG: rod shape-determining protein MreD [Ruminococcus sp.]|nr:rod shape-determining protein MreD [Ruminococcus sp.]
MNEKMTSFFRYLAYAMEIVLLYVLGTTPDLLPQLFGAKPTLLLCVALTAAIFEREIPAMVIGLVCGVLIDLGYSNSIGLFTITLTVVCFIVGDAANNLIRATFLNFLLYAFVAVGGIFMLYFLIRVVWAGVDNYWDYFMNHLLSRMVQTFVLSIPIYFVNKFIYHTLGNDE